MSDPGLHSHSSEDSFADVCESASIPDTTADATIAQLQRSFLLQQLEEAPEGKMSRTDANRQLRAEVKRELGLEPDLANRLRTELIQEGYIHSETIHRNTIYQITESGQEHLKMLPRFEEKGNARGRIRPVCTETREYQKAYLLLQLFRAPNHQLSTKQANRFDKLGRETLMLNAAAAREVRRALESQGYISIDRQGRSDQLELTDDGIALLGTLNHHPEAEIKLSGQELNELLEAARESASQFSSQPTVELEEALTCEILDLLKHGSGSLPIAAIRQRIREQHPDWDLDEEVFDTLMEKMKSDGRVRLRTDLAESSDALLVELPTLD